MRTDHSAPRVVLIEGAPGPVALMARAYLASVAALIFRTQLRWVGVLGSVAVALIIPVQMLVAGAAPSRLLWGVAAGAGAGLFTVVAMFVSATAAWTLSYMARRATRPAWVWVAIRGWSTAALWVEADESGAMFARFWGAFPAGAGAAAGAAFLSYLDATATTARAYPRTAGLEAFYARWGFVRTESTDMRGRPLLVRHPNREHT